MASIKKIKGKTGTSFKITATTGRDAQGKQRRFYKTFIPPEGLTAKQAEKAAKQAAAEFEKEIELGYHLTADQTFEEYAKYVIQLKKKEGLAKHTIALYEYYMERIVPAFGYMKLKDIRPQHLNIFYQELGKPCIRKTSVMARPKVDFYELLKDKKLSMRALAEKSDMSHQRIFAICKQRRINLEYAKRIANVLGMQFEDLFQEEHGETLSNRMIRAYHSFAFCVFAQAEKEMLIQYNPAARATPPREEHNPPNYFQPDDIIRIMEALESENIKYRTMIHLFIVTGCRRGEILALKWDKVDLENREIIIDRSLTYLPKEGIIDGPTKTQNIRIIKIPEETTALLRRYRVWYMEQQLMNGDRWNPTNYVFTRKEGSPIKPSVINDWLIAFSKRHGLPHINPHAFRHSAASIMISQGVDIVTVSKMLGHANTSMTTDTYAHIIEESKAKASECIADVILRKKAK